MFETIPEEDSVAEAGSQHHSKHIDDDDLRFDSDNSSDNYKESLLGEHDAGTGESTG